MNTISRGSLVWFTPQTMGYGYRYSVDHGIPATVLDVTPRRAQIEFMTKDSQHRLVRYVARTNLTPRKAIV